MRHPSDPSSVRIDCDDCIMRETPTCEDCIVTYLCERDSGTAVVISLDDVRSMKALADAGLVPELRHQAR